MSRVVSKPLAPVYAARGARPVSRFRRNFVRVASANSYAQLLAVGVSPVLSRLYAPDHFAVAAIFAAVLSFLLALASFRLEYSLPNCRTAQQAGNVLVAGLGTLLLMVVSVGLLLESADLWVQNNSWKAIAPYRWLLLAALLGGGMQQLLQAWFVREAELRAVGRSKVMQATAVGATGVGVGLFLPGPVGLVTAQVVGQWAAMGTLLRHSFSAIGRTLRRVRPATLRAVLRRFVRASALWTLASVLSSISLALPILLTARLYSSTELGWLALTQRAVGLPLVTLTSALGQSFWAEAARLAQVDRQRLRQLYLKATRTLCVLSIPLAAVCLAGPYYVGVLFGAEWQGAGAILAALTPMFVGSLVFAALNHLGVLWKQHWMVMFDLLRIAGILTVFKVAHLWQLPFLHTVLLVSTWFFLCYLLLFWLNLFASRRANDS